MKKRNNGALSNHKFAKILASIFVLAFIFSSIRTFNISKAATTDAVLSFNLESATAVVGEDFNLIARINPGSNTDPGVNAVQLDITFDPAIVRIASITSAAPFDILGTPDIDAANANGTLSVPLYITGSAVATIADVATLVFTSQLVGTDSSIDFAVTADAAVNDAGGTLVVGMRTGTVVTVTADVADSNPATLSGGSPSSALSAGITQATVSVATNENATCRYATTSGVDYDLMTVDTFTTTGATFHSFVASGLIDGGNYGYFVRCDDANGNKNLTDYLISFSVANQAVVAVTAVSDDNNKKKKKKLTSARKITNSKKVLSRGMILKERGKNFSKKSLVQLYFEKPGGGYHPPVQIKTSPSGSFMVTYRVNKPKGVYSWYAVDTKTNKKSKIIYFKVR